MTPLEYRLTTVRETTARALARLAFGEHVINAYATHDGYEVYFRQAALADVTRLCAKALTMPGFAGMKLDAFCWMLVIDPNSEITRTIPVPAQCCLTLKFRCRHPGAESFGDFSVAWAVTRMFDKAPWMR